MSVLIRILILPLLVFYILCTVFDVTNGVVTILNMAFVGSLITGAVMGLASHWPVAAQFRRVRFADDELDRRAPRNPWLRRKRLNDSKPGMPRPGYRTAWLALRGAEALIILMISAYFALVIFALEASTVDERLRVALLASLFFANLFAIKKFTSIFPRLLRRKRRLAIADANEAMSRDTRPPVLLLRAFECESDDDPGFWGLGTFEEALIPLLSEYGPVVAIGRPDDELPQLGAHREYVGENWQERVTELMQKAGMIVALLHESGGLLWELEVVFERGWQHKLIGVVPQRGGDLREALLRTDTRHEEAYAESLQPGSKTLAVVFDAQERPFVVTGGGKFMGHYLDAIWLAAWFCSRPRWFEPG